jgi:hypothetical protein
VTNKKIESQFEDASAAIQKHIAALKAIFPEAFVAPSEDFNGHEGGMWTKTTCLPSQTIPGPT